MIIKIILFLFLGFISGIFTGLIPGIHINLVATLLFINSDFILSFSEPFLISVFIISMTINHTFLDFLPSIFLGVPDEDTALSILPGHRMLLKGLGYEAVKLTAVGCFLGIVVAIILTPFFIETSPLFYPYLTKIIPFILTGLSLFLIFTEKNKILAFFIFLFSGILGYVTLNFTLIKQPLFPLFTGLFGTSLISISFLKNVKIPKQKITKIKLEKKQIFKALGLSVFSSSLVSFLPGVGSAQAATIASSFKKINEKIFLLMLGTINSITILLSFVALYAIKKPRSGVAVFVGKFLPNFSLKELYIFLLISLIVGIFSFILTILLAKRFSKIMEKVNYKKLNLLILIFLFTITPIISGWFALIILITATSLGIFCSLSEVKKIFLMGSLIIPVIIYHLL